MLANTACHSWAAQAQHFPRIPCGYVPPALEHELATELSTHSSADHPRHPLPLVRAGTNPAANCFSSFTTQPPGREGQLTTQVLHHALRQASTNASKTSRSSSTAAAETW